MSYISPEIIRGKEYRVESDIYAFGIIMWEIAVGNHPFGEVGFDVDLAFVICHESRLQSMEGIPDFYSELMESCWHEDPTKRPTSKQMCDLVFNWYFQKTQDVTTEIEDRIRVAQEFRVANISKYDSKESYRTHSLAIYTSQALPNLSISRKKVDK